MWIPETMAKARAPTAVILDMFVVILSLAGAVGWRRSGQFGLIRLIQTLTRWLLWPGSRHGQAPDTLIMRTILQKYLSSRVVRSLPGPDSYLGHRG